MIPRTHCLIEQLIEKKTWNLTKRIMQQILTSHKRSGRQFGRRPARCWRCGWKSAVEDPEDVDRIVEEIKK
jgi:predicted Zn-ribbon and HTH transcriptional regulator